MIDKAFSGFWTINEPDVVTETFDGQAVVLDLSNGHYFSLDGNAGRIWSLLVAGYSTEAVEAALADMRPELVRGLHAFLADIVARRLIRPGTTGRSGPAVIDEPWSDDCPTLVVYDDLADLIYADPIHDVDEEQGWPVQRPAGG